MSKTAPNQREPGRWQNESDRVISLHPTMLFSLYRENLKKEALAKV